ncbi:hypothetical protein OHA03_33845 [Streptomyces sp. NBC_00154]|nr:hypothetical protein [Streptomyces sp. NBC_00154]MCX5315738.1 hypothetical protein [Streptomyces sp. NBC_00154]
MVGHRSSLPGRGASGNDRYLDTAVAQLRAEGHDLKDGDVARLSPL